MKRELVRILIEEKAIVKLLKTIGKRRYYTRELLSKLKQWGHGHKLLVEAYDMGLVDRENVKTRGKGNWRVYNKLTTRGKELVRLAKQIGI